MRQLEMRGLDDGRETWDERFGGSERGVLGGAGGASGAARRTLRGRPALVLPALYGKMVAYAGENLVVGHLKPPWRHDSPTRSALGFGVVVVVLKI